MTEHVELVAKVFGERLRQLREKRSETTRSLADRAEMSPTYISNLERGKKTPGLGTVVRLAVALRCTVRGLVKDLDDRDLGSLVPKRK